MIKRHSGMTFKRPSLFLLAAMMLALCGHPVLAQDGALSAPTADTLLSPATPEAPSAVPSTLDTMNAPYDPIKLPESLSLGSGPRREQSDVKEIDPKDIPDILLEEMKEIERRCESNYFYSSFHDCRCIAVKFLDERMKSDPDIAQFIIFRRVNAQCPDKPAIAGFVYRSCYDMMKRDRPDFVNFCECVAKDMTEKYAERPLVNMSYIEGLRKDAFRGCGSLQNNTYRIPRR
jgi:hypothetical protein